MSANAEKADLQLRRRRYFSGIGAEALAAGLMLASGYRILAHRYKTHAGEIDLIILKKKRLAFVEVKRRATQEECAASISGRARDRIRTASTLWLDKHPEYRNYDIGFDLVFVTPRRFPIVMRDAL